MSICRVVAVMRNNARVCVCSNDICPPQTCEICSDPHIGRHFSARVSFLLFRSQNKKRVCPRRPRGCTFWGCDLRLSEYSILCYLIKCVWEQLAVFCSHDSLPLSKKHTQKTQICSTFLSDFSFYSFSWRRSGDEKCESCKSVTEMDHFKVAGVTFIPHICRINTFWNDWWVFCFCCFVSPSVRSPPLSWLMQIYIYSAGPCRGKLTGRLH